jgi:hypothetical protein
VEHFNPDLLVFKELRVLGARGVDSDAYAAALQLLDDDPALTWFLGAVFYVGIIGSFLAGTGFRTLRHRRDPELLLSWRDRWSWHWPRDIGVASNHGRPFGSRFGFSVAPTMGSPTARRCRAVGMAGPD